MKYKDIDITPFSEWIDYQFACFSEIIRYSKSFLLKNQYWLEAMEYSCTACNLSLTNEKKIVEKYIIDELEKMVTGLEKLNNLESFTFKKMNQGEYRVDKNGLELIDFRCEKISGALDFISKILEFEEIVIMNLFVQRIETCNRKIEPILINEIKILKIKIESLNIEKNLLQPKYDNVLKVNDEYNAKKNILKLELISKGELISNPIDRYQLEEAFELKNIEYIEFKNEYEFVTKNYDFLSSEIRKNITIMRKFENYIEKIKKYFED